jgi:hypothetical protein
MTLKPIISSLAAVNLLEGQHETPLRIISFNVLEGWGRDVSTDVASKAQQRCELQLRGVTSVEICGRAWHGQTVLLGAVGR